jgi:hypothetical protein
VIGGNPELITGGMAQVYRIFVKELRFSASISNVKREASKDAR